MKCRYGLCDGSGLIPFKKEGRVIPHAFVHCDCHPDYGVNVKEHYREVRPDDFDFPISYSYYRSLCQEHDWKDPGPDYPEEPKKKEIVETKVIFRHLPSDNEVAYLKNKLGEHLESHRRPQKRKFKYE